MLHRRPICLRSPIGIQNHTHLIYLYSFCLFIYLVSDGLSIRHVSLRWVSENNNIFVNILSTHYCNLFDPARDPNKQRWSKDVVVSLIWSSFHWSSHYNLLRQGISNLYTFFRFIRYNNNLRFFRHFYIILCKSARK